MANVKRISSSYSIVGTTGNTAVSIGDPTLSSALFSVHGNVAFDAGAGTGIKAVSGASSDITMGAIVWDNSTNKWSLSNDGLTYSPISTVIGTGIGAVVDDPYPTLGGNLTVNGFSITSISNNIVLTPAANTEINSVIQLLEISPGPGTNLPGYNLIYANVPAAGGSGVYVTNEVATGEELITKSKAFVYSIIF